MNKFLFATLVVGGNAAMASSGFAADEMARVISATPITQQVGVPRTACATYATPGVPPQCSTQTIYEARTVAYTVIYEYAGRQYSVQMPQNPGPTLRLQATSEQALGTPLQAPALPPPAPLAAGVTVIEPAMPSVEEQTVVYAQPYPAPVQVTYPGVAYYGSPYYGNYGSYWGPTLGLAVVGGYIYGGGRFFGGHGGHGGRGRRH